MRALTLYSRAYCSLCDVMLEQLQGVQDELQFSIEIIDVDADAQLVERFDELVPILMDGDTELFHYHFDQDRLQSYLKSL